MELREPLAVEAWAQYEGSGFKDENSFKVGLMRAVKGGPSPSSSDGGRKEINTASASASASKTQINNPIESTSNLKSTLNLNLQASAGAGMGNKSAPPPPAVAKNTNTNKSSTQRVQSVNDIIRTNVTVNKKINPNPVKGNTQMNLKDDKDSVEGSQIF